MLKFYIAIRQNIDKLSFSRITFLTNRFVSARLLRKYNFYKIIIACALTRFLKYRQLTLLIVFVQKNKVA